MKEKWPHASVEDIEHLGCAETCDLKRKQFNNLTQYKKPFLWIIDSQIESKSIAGIDLPATFAVILTTQVSKEAQQQLIGRATRRASWHNTETGGVQPSNKMVIMLDTTHTTSS